MASAEMSLKQFETKINSLQELDQNGESGFAREFQLLRQTSFKYKGNSNYSTKAGEYPINRSKNRFKDILPFDYSRVILPSTGDDGSDYINANFIKGVNGEKVYIASQGPLANTVNDFWRMLWAYKVKVVVMLCREEENGKKKCQRYWCEGDEDKLNFGGILVRTERSIGVGNDFVMRTLVAESHGEKLLITQFHYTAWPDHGVPLTAMPLIELIKLVRDYQQQDSPPIVLHCSAGCGRTGTICALDYTRSLLKEQKFKDLVPYRIVENLRKQRHAMVQTKGQYEFLCLAMCSLFREKLNLPLEEEHEDHLYENVVPTTPDTDSENDDFIPSSPVFLNKLPSQPVNRNDNVSSLSAPKVDLRNKPVVPKGAHPPSNPKRHGQIIEPQPGDANYVNVAFDLIDLSDGKPPPKSPDAAKPGNGNARVDGRSAKVPLSRQASAPDYFNAEKPRNLSDEAEYVVMPPRDTPKGRSLPSSSYENVLPGVQMRPPVSTRPAVSVKPSTGHSSALKPSNTEASSHSSGNPGRRSPNQTSTFPFAKERAAKPATPEKFVKRKEFPRTQSSSSSVDTHDRKHAQPRLPATVGPNVGTRYAAQLEAMNGLNRARVLPNEGRNPEDMDKVSAQPDTDGNSGLYASVDRSKSNRRAINDNTFRGADSVDGEPAPPVPKKSAELLAADEHESNYDAKFKASSLSKKILFLSKKPEVRGTTVENIGFGKRVAKPNGPRHPPKSWTVKIESNITKR